MVSPPVNSCNDKVHRTRSYFMQYEREYLPYVQSFVPWCPLILGKHQGQSSCIFPWHRTGAPFFGSVSCNSLQISFPFFGVRWSFQVSASHRLEGEPTNMCTNMWLRCTWCQVQVLPLQ